MITKLEVLCDWDGWVPHEGADLTWEIVEPGGQLHIYDYASSPHPELRATHNVCWQLVRIVDEV